MSGSSGIFVARLAEALSRHVAIKVITPAATAPGLKHWNDIPVHAFRYAPSSWQRLAHAPGGLPVALRIRPWLYLLLPFFMLSMLWSCLRHARHADLIHANWMPVGLVAGLASRLVGVPAITTIRGEDATRIMGSRLERYLMRICIHLNQCVVCVSEAMEHEMTRLFPQHAGRFLCIPNGVGTEFAVRDHGATVATGKLSLIIVASLIPRKRIDVAIDALARLSPAIRQSVRLIVVGDGPESSRLENQVRSRGLDEVVEFRGAVAPEEVPKELAQVDAMVLCSTSEGRPNALLEGMAAGLPIIASNIDGVRELVRPGLDGLLFPALDVEALAEHITTLTCNMELRRELAESARRRIAQLRLSWDVAAERYCRAYAMATAKET